MWQVGSSVNDYYLGQMIQTVFMPFVPVIAGFVLALLAGLLVYIAFRDGFLKGN